MYFACAYCRERRGIVNSSYCTCHMVRPMSKRRANSMYDWKLTDLRKDLAEWVATLKEGDQVSLFSSLNEDELGNQKFELEIQRVQEVYREGRLFFYGREVEAPVYRIGDTFFDKHGDEIVELPHTWEEVAQVRPVDEAHLYAAEAAYLAAELSRRDWSYTKLEKLRAVAAAAEIRAYDPDSSPRFWKPKVHR